MLKVIASNFEDGVPYKWIDFPQPNYASSSADMVMRDGKMVGMSMFNGYSYNERCVLSLGVVEQAVEVGEVLTLVWGEPQTTGKTSTEKHQPDRDPRARLADALFARGARALCRRQLAHAPARLRGAAAAAATPNLQGGGRNRRPAPRLSPRSEARRARRRRPPAATSRTSRSRASTRSRAGRAPRTPPR